MIVETDGLTSTNGFHSPSFDPDLYQWLLKIKNFSNN